MDVTRSATFIPEVWSDDIIASYKKKLVMAPLVRKMSFVGQKGDTLRIPVPSRGQANQKIARTQVQVQYSTELEIVVNINRHFEFSKIIEDIVKVQALPSQRRFYTEDAGYALARQKDTDIINLGRLANSGAGTNVYASAFTGGDGSTLYVAGSNNETALTDPGIRRMMQRLDDNDVPMDDRHLVIPPSSRNTLLGISRFTEQAFNGSGATMKNGLIGNIYGMEVHVTPQCDTTSGSNAARVALMFHRDAFALVEQMGIRTQTQNKLEHLGDLFVADTLYGVQILRSGALGADVPASAFAIAVPA
jgi:N4-gp56 family major capsid protein